MLAASTDPILLFSDSTLPRPTRLTAPLLSFTEPHPRPVDLRLDLERHHPKSRKQEYQYHQHQDHLIPGYRRQGQKNLFYLAQKHDLRDDYVLSWDQNQDLEPGNGSEPLVFRVLLSLLNQGLLLFSSFPPISLY